MAQKKSYREKIMSLVEERGLYSVMNNTKWRELKKGVAELPHQPPFLIKPVDMDDSKFDAVFDLAIEVNPRFAFGC